ncbi:thiamine pyrophosphate-binding protein [Pseudoclavibacter sp. VKM Ac-2867]|uniref:thiamine pyrophosphate-binding protein n=1 Tax=Pseudoclavibacter sp. VKM Ac-2867 TaxID=2783829 RepID=UPI00188C159B|nr:thiamine pyrophosphate-binding protein [Pseudoclavibacter sp. VKM Ac-2867]MBF4458992.1 thiamine pyrophosphate-binding protein [Pseudoclavibacter sp. VKM Ac-2867]
MSEKVTGGELVIRTLEALGAERVVGLPGQHALPMFDALGDSSLDYLGARVENNAAFMADGHARVTGTVTPLLLSAGPGALTALPGLQEAATASSPVLLISAQVPTPGIGGQAHGYLHELRDQESHFRGIAKGTWSIRSVDQIVPTLVEAWRTAQSAPAGPVYVEVPHDVQQASVELVDGQLGGLAAEAYALAPEATGAQLDAVARLLVESSTPRIYAGGGVVRSGAGELLEQLAEQLQAPVVTTYGGRSAFPWAHPLSAEGWIEDIATTEFLEAADVLLVVGTGLSELSSNYFRLAPTGTVIHVDADARVLGANHEGTITLRSDAGLALQGVLDRLRASEVGERADARPAIDELLATVRGRLDAQPLATERELMDTLRSAIPDEVATFWDMTISAYWAWSAWDARGGVYENGQCGGLGFGLPAAIGASFASRSRETPNGAPVVAISGDGGGLYGVAELSTLAQSQLSVTWLVVDDGGYGVLRGYMNEAYGRATATELTGPDYLAVARAFGIESRAVELDTLADELAASIRTPGPRVLVLPATLELFEATHTHRPAVHR